MSLNQLSYIEQEPGTGTAEMQAHSMNLPKGEDIEIGVFNHDDIIDFQPRPEETSPVDIGTHTFEMNSEWLSEINQTGKIPESLRQYFLDCRFPKELSDELNRNLRALARQNERDARYTLSLNPEMVISWEGMSKKEPHVIPRRLTLIENPRDVVVDALRLRTAKDLELSLQTDGVAAANRRMVNLGNLG